MSLFDELFSENPRTQIVKTVISSAGINPDNRILVDLSGAEYDPVFSDDEPLQVAQDKLKQALQWGEAPIVYNSDQVLQGIFQGLYDTPEIDF